MTQFSISSSFPLVFSSSKKGANSLGSVLLFVYQQLLYYYLRDHQHWDRSRPLSCLRRVLKPRRWSGEAGERQTRWGQQRVVSVSEEQVCTCWFIVPSIILHQGMLSAKDRQFLSLLPPPLHILIPLKGCCIHYQSRKNDSQK